MIVKAVGRGKDQDPDGKRGLDESSKAKSSKGKSFERVDRRRGRPASMRSPDDTPLRDANKDFMFGVLTARASRTLVLYMQEAKEEEACQWLTTFINENPITLSGTWEDISGDTFLRKMLATAAAEPVLTVGSDEVDRSSGSGRAERGADSTQESDQEEPASSSSLPAAAEAEAKPSSGVDPREIARRILDIRMKLAKEFIQDLSLVTEDNNQLLRQSLMLSLQGSLKMAAPGPGEDEGAEGTSSKA